MDKSLEKFPAFPVSDLARKANDVQHVANTQPVVLTHHGKERYVLLAVEEFKRLKRPKTSTRKAYKTSALPKGIKRELIKGIDAYLADEDA
jgi:prevent-host-death family protein